MYGTIDTEVVRRRREELLREASERRLERALRADREGRAAARWISSVGWELARISGRVRKSLRVPKGAG